MWSAIDYAVMWYECMNDDKSDERRKAECRRMGVRETTPLYVLNDMKSDERRKAECRRMPQSTPPH